MRINPTESFDSPRGIVRRAVPLALLIALLGVAACSTVREITEDHGDIPDPRQRWDAYHIYDYDFYLKYVANDSVTASYQIRVEEGRTASVRDLLRGKTYGRKSPAIQANFRDLFTEIHSLPTPTSHVDSVEYDPRFGFPLHIYRTDVRAHFDEAGQRHLDTLHIHVTVSGFRALDLDY